jgi:hypothetical protein
VHALTHGRTRALRVFSSCTLRLRSRRSTSLSTRAHRFLVTQLNQTWMTDPTPSIVNSA